MQRHNDLVAKVGLEKGIEVYRPISWLGALLGLCPEEELDQGAQRLDCPVAPSAAKSRWKRPASCLGACTGQSPCNGRTRAPSAARTSLERGSGGASGQDLNQATKWCDPDSTRWSSSLGSNQQNKISKEKRKTEAHFSLSP